jgi:hypothetical protein
MRPLPYDPQMVVKRGAHKEDEVAAGSVSV